MKENKQQLFQVTGTGLWNWEETKAIRISSKSIFACSAERESPGSCSVASVAPGDRAGAGTVLSL